LVQRSPAVILDGAHNAQKIAALVADLPLLLGQASGGKLIVVAGVLAAKDHLEIVGALAPHAAALICTAPRVLAKGAADPSLLAADAQLAGFTGETVIEPDPLLAVERALERAGVGDVVLVTGSLYLVGNVRGRWHPDDRVLLQRTPWRTPARLNDPEPRLRVE
jgi:dihydrofolate synthase/folylpolyglutamate synthase